LPTVEPRVPTRLGARVAGCEWNIQADTWRWEPALFDVFGVEPYQVIPSTLALPAMTHPDDVATTQSMLHSAQHGRGITCAHRIIRGDGSVRQIHVTALVAFDPLGVPAVLHGAVCGLSDWNLPLSPHNMGSASDADLTLCLRAQMPEALVEAYQRHSSHMSRIVRPFLNNSLSADDIIQDVFEELFRHPERFDVRRGSLSTYLNMNARSRCIDLGRSLTNRRKREGAREHFKVAQPAEYHALSGLSRMAIRGPLESLPPNERIAIEMAFFGGLSYRAVGVHLGTPEGTVKARIKKGLWRLRMHPDILEASRD
jgi:RNA polymerase sigma-70 factor, ECF subfamily